MSARKGTTPGRLAVLLLAALLYGCGADGGVGGTGISTITGNVSTGSAAMTTTLADLEGITVGIRGTSLSTATDTHGDFQLEGEFDGDVTVEFEERDGTLNMLPVEVPSGGTVSLRNVRFSEGLATPEQIDVRFEGFAVDDATCDADGGIVEVSDSRNTFVVNFADTALESDDGCPATPQCSDVLHEFRLRVSGIQSEDGILANRVRLIICKPGGRRR